MNKIKGRVARILNSRELVINRGAEHGIVYGMLFDVLYPGGEDIKDPDTGEVLGSVERSKIRVRVVDVQEKLSVASTYKTYEVNVGGLGGFGLPNDLQSLLKPPKYIQKVQTLKTDELTAEQIRENESVVKTGDPVIQVEEVPTEPIQ